MDNDNNKIENQNNIQDEVLTIWVTNIDSSVKVEEVLKLFSYCGRVKTIIVKNLNKHCKDALLVFDNSQSVDTALLLNGVVLGNMQLKVIKDIPTELIYNSSDSNNGYNFVKKSSLESNINSNKKKSPKISPLPPEFTKHSPKAVDNDTEMTMDDNQNSNFEQQRKQKKQKDDDIRVPQFSMNSSTESTTSSCSDSSNYSTDSSSSEHYSSDDGNVPTSDNSDQSDQPDKNTLILEDILSSGIAASKNAINEAKRFEEKYNIKNKVLKIIGDIGKKATDFANKNSTSPPNNNNINNENVDVD